MKQTKHIRRLWGLMLLLIAMLMPQGVWAASHYDAGYDNTETTYSADGIKFKVVYLRMYNYQGNNSHFSNNPLVTITAGGHTHTFHLGDLCGESGNRTFYYNGEGKEDPYKGSGRFSKNTYKQTVDGIPVTAYFDNQRNDQKVTTNPDKNYIDNGNGSDKWCTADLTIEIGVQTAATVNISGQWRDWSDGVNTNSENYSWNFSIDKHTCNSDTESTASTYLKDNATCTAAAVYYKSCSWCGEAQSDTITSGSALGHSISGGKCSRCSHGFIYYTSTNNAVVTPYRANFGTSVDVVGNTYSNGQGVIETSAPVTQIGDECFYHKNALKSIQIPATVTSIGRHAFTSCTGLTGTLVIPDAVTSIGNDAFELCSTLSGVTFGSSLQSIGEYAFTSCSKLSGTLTLPASLTTIGESAFKNCSGFTGNLTIPNKVTTIGEDAFDSCSGLTGTLTIPASVTTLQAYSFSDCPFTTVRLEKNSMYAWANYVFNGLSSKGTLLVPSNLVKTYQANKYWLGAFKTITCITHNIQSVAQKAASCTVDGNTAHYKCSGCDALFTNAAGTATTTLAAVTVKATGHGKTKKYAATYAWEVNASDPTCTFTLKCLDCQADVVKQPLYTTSGTYGSFSATTTPANCTEEGVVTCQAAGKYTDTNGKNAPYTESTTSNAVNTTTYVIPATGHGHKGYTPSYAWIGTADDPTCTFTLFCEDCKTNVVNEVLTTDAAAANGFYAQTAHVDEGCTDAGYTTYAATGKYPATSPSVAYTEQTPNVKTYGITAHGHDYADAVWTWADDGHSATCSRTCEYCGDEQKADVILEGGISSEETQHATCTTKGVHTYTATATVKDKTYTDVKEVDDIEALDHLFGEGSWEWVNNEAGCAAFCTVVCEREGCGARMSNSAIFGRGLTAEVTTPPTCTTKGVHTYTAIAVMPGAKRTDVREFEDIPALGHGHQGYTPSYAWTGTAADPICKFRLFCEACQTAVVDEELILGLEAAGGYYTQTDHHDATCTDRGSTTYAAMGQYDAEAPSVVYTEEHPDIHIYEISALGHTYTDAVWTWADDGHSATCSLTCSVCDDEQHTDVTLGNGITSQVVTPATCTAAGNTLYSAIATVKDKDYISSKRVEGDVAALGHNYADAVWTWADDGHSATCSLTCSVCDDEQHTDVTLGNGITSAVTTAATCAENGNTTFTATATMEGVTYTETKTANDIAALGHTFADNDTRHELCTTCGHTFFHYTFEPGRLPMIMPGPSARFLDPKGNSLEIVSFLNSDDIDSGESYMEFDGELATIGESAFLHSMFEGSYIIPFTVTTIGDAAFANNRKVKGIELGASVTTIGVGAFADCSSITGPLTIPASVTEMGYNAFSGCGNVETFVIPCTSSLTTEDLRNAIIPDEKLEIRHADDSEKTLVSAATCRNDAVYHLVCSACGLDDNITEPHTATGHTFADDDINHELCTTCGMSFAHTIFYYTVEPGADPINPYMPKNLLDAVGNPLTIVSNTVDEAGNGVMEFDGTLVTIGERAFSGAPFIGSLTIPASVTTIGKCAFEACNHLTGLELGASVTTIGALAFERCSGLTGTMTIPASVTTIGELAFAYCDHLTGLELGASVTTIGEYAFNRCNGLTGTLTIPDAVTTIGVGAFAYCDNLTGIELGASVTTIGNYAFNRCNGLTGLKLGAAVTTIGEYAFSDCYALTGTLTIPDAVTTIGNYAFSNCYDLTDLELGASVTTIGRYAFNRCNGLTGLKLGAAVTTIGEYAFSDCTSLTGTLTIPDAVTTIGKDAFFNCSGLTGLKLGASVTTIGEYAFYECEYLAGIVKLPATVTTIGGNAFRYCNRVKSFYVLCTSPLTQDDLDNAGIEEKKVAHYHADESNMTLVQASTCATDAIYHIVCDACGVEEDAPVLGTATGLHTFADDDINHELCTTCGMSFVHTIFYYTVEPGADPVDLYSPENLLDAVGNPLAIMSNTVDEEGNGVMEFDGTLVTIGKYAFSVTPFIGSLTIPSTVTTIGDYAFYGCSGLTGLELGASVTTIGESAFESCSGLTGTLTIPDAVTRVGYGAFFDTNFENCITPCTIDLEDSGIDPEIITYLHHYDEHSYCSICGRFDMPSEPSIGDLVRFIDFLHQPEAETAGYNASYVKDIAARILGHETAVWNPEKKLKTNIKIRTGAVYIETNVKQLPTAESQDVQMLDDEGLLWAVLDNNADLRIVTSMPKIKMKSCHGLFSNISTTDYIYGLEHLDLQDVTDMSDMFAGCNALQEVDLYDLYAPNVTNTSRMFYGCERIEYIDLKGCLTMTGVTEKADMFTGCGTKATDSDGDPYVTVVNVEESPEEITATTEGTGWDDNYMTISSPM